MKFYRAACVRSAGRIVLLAGSAGLAVWLFFGNPFPRDAWDPRHGGADEQLQRALVEHGYGAMRGLVRWRDVPMFHPVQGTLGYSDALLLPSALYALIRAAGMGAEPAWGMMLCVLGLAGFSGFYALARRAAGMEPGLACAAAVLFINFPPFRTALANGHAQLLTAWLVPAWCGLLWPFSGRMPMGRGPALRAVSAGLGLGLLALSSFYVAWFLGVFLGVTAMIAWIGAGRARWAWLRGRGVLLGLGAGALFLSVVAFLHIHGSGWRAGGGRAWTDVVLSLPVPSDWHLAGSDADVAGGRYPGLAHERDYGYPLATGLAVLAALAACAVHPPGRNRAEQTAWRSLSLGVLACGLLMTQVGGYSPWFFVFHGVPGARAIRAVFRFQVVLAAPAALLLAVSVERWTRRWPGGRVGPTAGAVLLAALTLQGRTAFAARVAARGTPASGRVFPARVEAVPSDARCFFVAPADGASPVGRVDPLLLQTAALSLAQANGIPTINGYSGVFPKGWHLQDPAAPGYPAAVYAWVARYGLTGVYAWDWMRGRWEGPHDRESLARRLPTVRAGVDLVGGGDGWPVELAVAGWSAPEPGGVWSEGDEARLLLPLEPGPAGDGPEYLVYRATAFVHPAHPVQTVEWWINGMLVQTHRITMDAPWVEGRIPLPEHPAQGSASGRRVIEVVLRNRSPVRPAEVGHNEDLRRLGVRFVYLSLDGARPAKID